MVRQLAAALHASSPILHSLLDTVGVRFPIGIGVIGARLSESAHCRWDTCCRRADCRRVLAQSQLPNLHTLGIVRSPGLSFPPERTRFAHQVDPPPVSFALSTT
jgi:hypothetical protein